jgi:hypothetical protein
MFEKIYPWMKLLLGFIVFVLHDTVHVTGTPFIIIFVLMELIILVSDILLVSKSKVKITPTVIGWYVLYNYVGYKIIMFD